MLDNGDKDIEKLDIDIDVNSRFNCDDYTSQKHPNNRCVNAYGRLKVICIILAISTVVCISIMLMLLKQNINSKEVIAEDDSLNERLYTQQEVDGMVESASANATEVALTEFKASIKDSVRNNVSMSEILRRMFPENIVYTARGGYEFATISDVIPRNTILDENIYITDEGISYYEVDGDISSKTCIDISEYNGEIDWQEVKDSGIVDFVMIRVGYRGYGSGKLVLDSRFDENVKGALTAGIPVGVYFFSQATTIEEAVEEAQFVKDAIAPYNITYPIAIDIEKVDDSQARGNLISKEDRTKIVNEFCQEMALSGYIPMLYGNTFSYFDMLDMEQLCQYNVWYAFYDSYIYYPYTLKMWQYSAAYTVPGIKEKVDINIYFM